MRMRPKTTALLTFAAGLFALGGCTHMDIDRASFWRQMRTIPVEVEGEAPAIGARVAVDVRNGWGSVIVEVDDTLESAVVDAELIRPRDIEGSRLPESDAPGTVEAFYEPASEVGGASTLRVTAGLSDGYPTGTGVALRVRVPRCDGLNVESDGGPIVVIGTEGAVTAQSGVRTGMGGRIEYRTSHPLRDPVALVTTAGRISAVIAPEGAGVIELDTEDGQVAFNSAYGTQTEVNPGIRSYRGTWNGGKVPFVARTGDGDVQVIVKPEAEMYSTADDWMALFGK